MANVNLDENTKWSLAVIDGDGIINSTASLGMYLLKSIPEKMKGSKLLYICRRHRRFYRHPFGM